MPPSNLCFCRGYGWEILEKVWSYCRLVSGRILFVLRRSTILGSICTNSRLSILTWLSHVEFRSLLISSTVQDQLWLFFEKWLVLEEFEGSVMRRNITLIWFKIINQTNMVIIPLQLIIEGILIVLFSRWQDVAICAAWIDLLVLKCYGVILKAIS